MRQGLIGVLLVVLAVLAHGQTSTGSLTGIVEDQQQSVVPEASVIITNIQTGRVVSVQTSDAGVYSVASLQPGEYNVTVEKAGFQKERINSVFIETATTKTLNVQL